jgi:hypothetical protein
MKIEFDTNGALIVHPENNVEAYALRKWCEENYKFLSHTISMDKLLISSEIKD